MATVSVRNLERAVRGFRALGDETRLRILERLRDGEECVCNLTGLLERGQSLLSFHLKILRDAGILRARREGRWVYYSLDPEVLAEMDEVVTRLRTAAGRVTRRCC